MLMCSEPPSKINSPDRKDIKNSLRRPSSFFLESENYEYFDLFLSNFSSHNVASYDAEHNLFDFSKTTIKNV